MLTMVKANECPEVICNDADVFEKNGMKGFELASFGEKQDPNRIILVQWENGENSVHALNELEKV